MEHFGTGGTDLEGLRGTGVFSHASIVWGGDEETRDGVAYRMAQALVCAAGGKTSCGRCAHCEKSARRCHPDIIVIDRPPDARGIQVDQIRSLREDAIIMPNEASIKVYIIRHAETMNMQAQNAILKLLEEPPESSSFILSAENPAGLLPTVRSRCVELLCELDPVPEMASETAAAFCDALVEGALKLCAFSFTLEKLDKGGFTDFIDSSKSLLEKKLRRSVGGGKTELDAGKMMKAIDVLGRAKDYFESNVGLVHIAGMICAELI